MAIFDFFTITPQQALAFTASDLLLTLPGSAVQARVVFNGPAEAPTTISVTLDGHTVEFSPAIQGDRFLFADQSFLSIGNAEANSIAGLPTDDAVFGGGGNDTILGHGGDDRIQGNQGDDRVLTDEGADVVFGGQGNDILVTGIGGAAVERGDFAQGNLGDDTIVAGNGGDTLLGGQGNDSIQGLGGADIISGDRGDDTLSGGAGADTFRGFGQGGDDRIVDFKAQEGDLILLDHGSTFEVVQSGANTLVLIDHGGATITLVGVDMSTLQGTWIGVA